MNVKMQSLDFSCCNYSLKKWNTLNSKTKVHFIEIKGINDVAERQRVIIRFPMIF